MVCRYRCNSGGRIMDQLLMQKLGKAIHNMFEENWKNFELGSKQADLVENYVLTTIVGVFKDEEE